MFVCVCDLSLTGKTDHLKLKDDNNDDDVCLFVCDGTRAPITMSGWHTRPPPRVLPIGWTEVDQDLQKDAHACAQ